MKKVIVVLVVLFIGILFAGCTSQPSTPAATPTPTAVPTTATPVPTPMPTPVVTPNMTANVTAVPTAVPTPVPTPNVVTITFTQALTMSPVGTIYVPVGTTVSWVNNDPYKPHGISSVGGNNGYNFGTVAIPYHSMYSVTFKNKGAYDYVTVFQPLVGWKIVVT